MQDFFQHENSSFPSAMSDGGKLYACQKSQLVSILETFTTSSDHEPDTNLIIISALVHTLQPKNFKD